MKINQKLYFIYCEEQTFNIKTVYLATPNENQIWIQTILQSSD